MHFDLSEALRAARGNSLWIAFPPTFLYKPSIVCEHSTWMDTAPLKKRKQFYLINFKEIHRPFDRK